MSVRSCFRKKVQDPILGFLCIEKSYFTPIFFFQMHIECNDKTHKNVFTLD